MRLIHPHCNRVREPPRPCFLNAEVFDSPSFHPSIFISSTVQFYFSEFLILLASPKLRSSACQQLTASCTAAPGYSFHVGSTGALCFLASNTPCLQRQPFSEPRSSQLSKLTKLRGTQPLGDYHFRGISSDTSEGLSARQVPLR